MLTSQRLLSPKARGSEGISGFVPWRVLIRHLFTAPDRQDHLPRELSTLSDHLLLDIGVDPREVPNRAAESISRPDLGYLVPSLRRSTARS